MLTPRSAQNLLMVPPSPNTFRKMSSTDSSGSSCGAPSPATRIRKMVPIAKPIRAGPRLSGESFHLVCDLFDLLCRADTEAVRTVRMTTFLDFQLKRTQAENFAAKRFLNAAISKLQQLDDTITFMQFNMLVTEVFVHENEKNNSERILRELTDALTDFLELYQEEEEASPPPPPLAEEAPTPRLLLSGDVVDELFHTFDVHNTGCIGARTISRFISSILAHSQSHDAQTLLVRLRHQLEPFILDNQNLTQNDFSECVMSAAKSTVASLRGEDPSCWWDAEQLVNSITREVAQRNVVPVTPNKPALKLSSHIPDQFVRSSSGLRLTTPKFAEQHVVVPPPSFRTIV